VFTIEDCVIALSGDVFKDL